MISNKSFSAITKTVEKVVRTLRSHNIDHEVEGDLHTFSLSPTCSIHTQHCTIEIMKNEISVNEKPADNLDHMIELIREVE